MIRNATAWADGIGFDLDDWTHIYLLWDDARSMAESIQAELLRRPDNWWASASDE